MGRDYRPLLIKKANSLGHNTHTHTHTHTHSHSHTQTHTSPIQSKAMYVKNPKFHFGYHNITNSNNCNRFNSNYSHSLGLSKTTYSKKKPHNNLSTSKAI